MTSLILKTLFPCVAAAFLLCGCAGQRTDQDDAAGSRPAATTRVHEAPRLPAGVERISVEEVREMVVSGGDLVLIDTRPGPRYRRSHLPGARSMPAATAAAGITGLKVDRDRLLVFYGEGRT